MTRLRLARAAWVGMVLSSTLLFSRQLEAEVSPVSVAAEDLVSRIDLANTDYKHGKWDVEWGSTPHCFTDCSGFLDAVLIHSYHWKRDDFRNWLKSARPNAAMYYQAIKDGNGFVAIAGVQEIVSGDVLAVQYLKRTDNSGHIMIADGPAQRRPSAPPLEPQTVQWDLPIIDCSESGHGVHDTRHKMGDAGKDHPGLGKGMLRLYTRDDGRVVGFSWSELKASSFKSADSEPILVGRLKADFHP